MSNTTTSPVLTETTLRALGGLLTAAGLTKTRNKMEWTHKGEAITLKVVEVDGGFAAYQV